MTMQGNVTNRALVRWSGGFVETEVTPGSEGRVEGFLSLDTATTPAAATNFATGVLGRAVAGAPAITAELQPLGDADTPYLGTLLGATVSALDPHRVPQDYQLQGFTVTEDEEGNPHFVPEVAALALLAETRAQRWLKAMSNGTLSGSVLAASPGSPPQFQTTVTPADSGSGGGARFATAVVAASDSTDASKAAADYVCTGTDDQIVIQQAIDAVQAHSSYNNGGDVLLLEGRYFLSGPIEVGDDRVFPSLWLHGVGGGTVLYGVGADALVHQVGYLYQSIFSDMYLKNQNGDGHCFDHSDSALGVEWVTWERLWIEGSGTGILCNVEASGGAFDFCAIRNNWFSMNRFAIHLYQTGTPPTGGVVECGISDNIIDEGDVVIDMGTPPAHGWSLTYEGNVGGSCYVEIGGVDSTVISGNTLPRGMNIHDLNDFTVEGNNVDGDIVMASVSKFTIAGNEMDGSPVPTDCDRGVISGNRIADLYLDSCQLVTVVGNQMEHHGNSATTITLDSSADCLIASKEVTTTASTIVTPVINLLGSIRNKVSGNMARIDGTGQWTDGVLVQVGSDDNMVTDNDFFGAITGSPVNDAATGTYVSGNR